MQNDEYLNLVEAEWQKVLGVKDDVTPEEKEELRKILEDDDVS